MAAFPIPWRRSEPRVVKPKIAKTKKKSERKALIVMFDGEGRAGCYVASESWAIETLPIQCRYSDANGRRRFLWALIGFASVFIFLMAILYEEFYRLGIPVGLAFGIAPWPALPFAAIGWIIAPLPKPIYVISRTHLAAQMEGEIRTCLLPQTPDMAIRTQPSEEKRVDPKSKKVLEYIRSREILAASYRHDSLKMDDERLSLMTPKSNAEKLAIGMLLVLPVVLLIVIFLLFTVSTSKPESTTITTNPAGTPTALNGTPVSALSQADRERLFPPTPVPTPRTTMP